MRGQVNFDVIFSAVLFLTAFAIFVQNFFAQITPGGEPQLLKISARNLGIFLLSHPYTGNPYIERGGFGENGYINTTKLLTFFGMSPYHLWYVFGAKYGFRIKKEPIEVIYAVKFEGNNLLVRIFNQNCRYYAVLAVNATWGIYPLVAQGKTPGVIVFPSLPQGAHHLYIAVDCGNGYGYADRGVIKIA